MQASPAGAMSTAVPLEHQTELLCDLCLPLRLLLPNLLFFFFFSYSMLFYFKFGCL